MDRRLSLHSMTLITGFRIVVIESTGHAKGSLVWTSCVSVFSWRWGALLVPLAAIGYLELPIRRSPQTARSFAGRNSNSVTGRDLFGPECQANTGKSFQQNQGSYCALKERLRLAIGSGNGLCCKQAHEFGHRWLARWLQVQRLFH